MPNVSGAYCAIEDMRTGDIAVPSYTTKAQYITGAAQEIDAALGHLYVTPFDLSEQVEAERPAALYLKKINWLLASGRMIADVAAAGEDNNLNAYAKRLLDEALEMLGYVQSGNYIMTGADTIGSPNVETPTGPLINNEDNQSLVEQFYTLRRPSPFYMPPIPPTYPPVIPYDDSEVTSA